MIIAQRCRPLPSARSLDAWRTRIEAQQQQLTKALARIERLERDTYCIGADVVLLTAATGMEQGYDRRAKTRNR
jgi:hypothetical protein